MVEIIEEKPVSLSHVKKYLNDISKKTDLNYRSNKTLDYVNYFKLKSVTQVEKIAKAIDALKVPRLKMNHIYKIIDINPKDLDEIKVVMQNFGLAVSNDNLKKIVKTLNE